MKLNKHSLVLLLLTFVLTTFKAQRVLDLYDSSKIITLGSYLGLYEDKTAGLGIDQVSQPDFQKNFVQSNENIPNYNVTSSRIWSKILLRNLSDKNDWYLESTNASVSYVNLYTQNLDGSYSEVRSGFNLDSRARDVNIRSPLFRLHLPKDSTMTLYVCMYDVVPLQIHLSVGNTVHFFEKYEGSDFFNGAFFGLLFMLVIYNLFIYFSVRDRVFLYYIIYVLTNACFTAFVTGYAVKMPEWFLYVFRVHPSFVPFLLGGSSALFSIVFLDMKKTYPIGYRITATMIVLLFSVPIADLLGYKGLSVILIQLFGLLCSIVLIGIGLIMWRNGYKPARFFLLAWSFYLIGLFIYISADLKIIPFNTFTHNSLEIGTAIEAILLSRAVGDKLNNFKLEKEKAQEQTLIETQKNAELVKQQNVVLEQKVKERTAELQEQKEVVEEKQKEILDSIHYAKRIQNTLLAHKEFVDANLPNNFILFKPKDIVSGDFYWAAKKDQFFYIAACDSTGHGVPGAFMSLLNITFLNEAIAEKNLMKPNEIFNHVRKRLIESISQDEQKDGMDGILLCYNTKSGKMTYAGANNGPVVLYNNVLEELPTDKMPVGKGEKDQSFSLFEIDLKPGAQLYLYTDGFADQFGGPKGKKFKYKQLNELIISLSGRSLDHQKQELDKAFDAWRGELEQVDDVCIIGVRV